jgi:hypothetical protein
LFAVHITKISPAKQFVISFIDPRFHFLKKLNRREKYRKIGMMECWNDGEYN